MSLAPADRPRPREWAKFLAQARGRFGEFSEIVVEGSLNRMVGMTLEAVGCEAAVGGRCLVDTADGKQVEAEVVGFSGDKLFLMPTGDIRGLMPGARVIPTRSVAAIPVGDGLLGRVLDGAGRPLDGLGELRCTERLPLARELLNPLMRRAIREPLDVGIRSINSLMTVGGGQRIGLFAGSGVGKSVLLGMMTRYTKADVTVVGLIGERGREVQDFVSNTLGPDGMRRAVVVATPADNPPLMRLHGAWLATAIAEYFRDRGLKVLLLLDSLTRFAQAQREIALAIGEPPATKGYPPSVFARLPQLVERAGNSDRGEGSITAFYTVLVEGDDQNDPIADAARAILDGHIVLSRRLAESGLYPAIDVEASISRAMHQISTREQLDLAIKFKQLYSTYQQNRDLIAVGAYRRGADPRVDLAIEQWPRILEFLRQDMYDPVGIERSQADLQNLVTQFAAPPHVPVR
ncbi:MAG: flagellar protein export ATPase FliI [Steroidobacteraceae bacterium]|nr:flagellar protein export ATPase FliI [Steroidobacteraceae bacterium]